MMMIDDDGLGCFLAIEAKDSQTFNDEIASHFPTGYQDAKSTALQIRFETLGNDCGELIPPNRNYMLDPHNSVASAGNPDSNW